MKDKIHVAELGATASCTLRLLEDVQRGDDRSALLQADAWFGSVKAAVALGKQGHQAVLQIKTGHAFYPKKFIEDTLKDAPGGVWIVLESIHEGIPLIAIGYRYSTRTTLFFVATKNAGSTKKGSPYEMKVTDDYGNVHVRDVDRPDIISNFFQSSNTIDRHNQARQFELALEKRWLTKDCFFRLFTTIIGFNVVDCYRLADHHGLINHRIPDSDYKMTMVTFAGFLSYQLLTNVELLLSFYNPTANEVRSLTNSSINQANTVTVQTPETLSTLTPQDQIFLSLRVLYDANQGEHHQIAYEITTGGKGKKRRKTRLCFLCNQDGVKHLVGFGCYNCNQSFCCPYGSNKNRDCFLRHVQAICRRTTRVSS